MYLADFKPPSCAGCLTFRGPSLGAAGGLSVPLLLVGGAVAFLAWRTLKR